jgi:predicted AAA+ superfamily ATPase
MKEVFKKLITDFHERTFGRIVARDYTIPTDTKKIVSLIGVRRSGKTYILFSLIKQLRQRIDPANIIYINFEDDRLFPLSVEKLDDLMEGYYELYPQKRNEKVYLFLDEVQNIDGWERYVRRIYDTLDLQLYITGSSSKLLSSEIATSLRGRTITYEIFPFSFREYLRYKEIEINLHSSKSISFIKNAFESYVVDGGFAETFDESLDVQKRILKDYLDLIIYKDIIERYHIKNQSLLKHLIKYMFVNMGTLVSINRLYNDYKSQGYKVGKDTLQDYLSYLQEAYALFTIPIHRHSVREEQRNPKKLYAIDNGFKKLFSISPSDDFSKLYENLAFLHLRRTSSEVYYFKDKQEVDLYVHNDREQLINVSYQIEDAKTLRREINAFREGMRYFRLEHACLVTAQHEETIKVDEGLIEVIPMWKWLLR